jgi:hypothetical protein
MKVYRAEDGGLRVAVAGVRVHHGLTGCLMAVCGLLLAYHDRRDVTRWLDIRSY